MAMFVIGIAMAIVPSANAEALIVIGIGGSYLGARAAIEMLTNNFYNLSENS